MGRSLVAKLFKREEKGSFTRWFELWNRRRAVRRSQRTLGSGLEALESRLLLASDLLPQPLDANLESPPAVVQTTPEQTATSANHTQAHASDTPASTAAATNLLPTQSSASGSSSSSSMGGQTAPPVAELLPEEMGIPADLPREYWDYPGSAYQLMNDPEYRRAAEAAWSEFAAQPRPSEQASDSTSPPITPEQQRLLDQIAQENGGDWSRLTSDQMQRLRDAGLVVHRYDGLGGYDYEVIHVGDKYYVYYEPWLGDYQLQQIAPDTVAPQAAVDLAWNKPTDALAPRNTRLTPELIEAKFRELYAHDPDAIRLLDLLKERGWRIELRDFYLHDWYIYLCPCQLAGSGFWEKILLSLRPADTEKGEKRFFSTSSAHTLCAATTTAA